MQYVCYYSSCMRKLDTLRTVLIIVDMQDFFLQHFSPATKKELIENQLKIIDLCIKNNLPIVALEYKCRGVFRGETINVLKKRIAKAQSVTIIKERNSGFTQTNLEEVLKNLKVKNIILMGVNANGCVQDTAIGAIHRGYQVITSFGIMASASRKDMCLSKKNEDWFIKNTFYFENLESLLRSL